MPEALADALAALPPGAEDAVIAAGLLLPVPLLGAVILRGFSVWPLLAGLLRRQAWISAVFVLLIAVSVGIGVGLIAQDRGLREGTARAAEKFDLVVAAPGSEITAMLAAVYLQPSALPLIDGWSRRSPSATAGGARRSWARPPPSSSTSRTGSPRGASSPTTARPWRARACRCGSARASPRPTATARRPRRTRMPASSTRWSGACRSPARHGTAR
jgi:hypothetical protein